MFRIFAVIVTLALVVLFGRAALTSGDYVAESAIVIEASPKQVMPYLDNFHGWASWWPPERQDPGIVRRFSGAPSGPGMAYSWNTQGTAGSGRMTIVAERPDVLTIQAVQTAPLATTATLVFELTAVDGGTRIVARQSGHNDVWTRMRHPLGIPVEQLETRLGDALTYLKLAIEAV